MSFNRTASRMTPMLLRSHARAHGLRYPPRGTASAGFPRAPDGYAPALAILMPRRNIETDRNASSDGGRNFPPPGFNASEAKKPLPGKDAQAQQSGAKEGKEAQGLKREGQSAEVAAKGAKSSANAKTKADEKKDLDQLAAEKAAADKNQDKKALEGKKEESKQLTMWQKIKKEAAHYWDGTKLLAAEVRISSKLALKMAAGYELTRRETRQLHRTVKDLSRLVPFSVFIIVPLGELLIPVVLKLFPNFLPSTFEDLKTRDAKTSKLRETRKEVSNFLRTTLKETGLPVSPASAQREEFAEFFRKVRTTGEEPTKADVIKVCKIFKDDLTLDNLSRPQLVAICRYMSLNTFGTDAMLRYNIRHRMRQIKRDDKAIFLEGVDSLSVTELQSACAARGLRTHGLSPARLREDLQMWLDLRLKYGVPSTLLVLSNAYVYAMGKESEFNSQIDALQAVLSSIPEELFHEIELEVHTAEGAATNKQRLEVLKEQQELIEEENQQRETSQSGRSTPNDTEDIDDKEEALAEAGKEAADPKAPEAREAKEAEKA